jgi:prefoldin subunit 5
MSAKSASDAARAEIEKQQKQISDLEGTRDELTKNMNDLTNRIGGLEGQIKETERKLAASEGDRQSLQKELKRLLAEKAELERKFNDLAVLREQVKKLREELHIARRLDFIRRGLYGFDKKGGELLNQGIHSPGPSTLTNNTPGLNVDLSTSGDSKASTNAPAPVTAPK